MSRDGKLIVSAISKFMETLKEEFDANHQEKDRQITKPQREVDVLKNKLATLQEQADSADACERTDTLIFRIKDVPW